MVTAITVTAIVNNEKYIYKDKINQYYKASN